MKSRFFAAMAVVTLMMGFIIMPVGAASAAGNPCLNKSLTVHTKTGALTKHMRAQVLACVRAAKKTGAGVIVMTVPSPASPADFNTSGRVFQLMLAKGCKDWSLGNGLTQPGWGHCAVDLQEGGVRSGSITLITGGIGDGG